MCYVVTSKVDNWSLCVVQKRLINVLDGVVSVLILLQRRLLPLETSDPFRVVEHFRSLRAVINQFMTH